MANTDGQTHGGGSGPAKGTYAYAKKQNPKIDSLIKQRKGLKKGTKEYNAIQNQINTAYGKGPTNRPTGKDTPSSKPSAPASMQRRSASTVENKSAPKATLKTKPAAESKPKTEAKPAAAVKSTSRRAERLRSMAAKRTERSDRRAAKYRPGGKKYTSEARLEREEARGLGPTARVDQYRRAMERTANRRDIRGERRAMRMEGRAQKAENRAAMKARSAEAREERKTTYSRKNGGKVYRDGGKVTPMQKKKVTGVNAVMANTRGSGIRNSKPVISKVTGTTSSNKGGNSGSSNDYKMKKTLKGTETIRGKRVMTHRKDVLDLAKGKNLTNKQKKRRGPAPMKNGGKV